MKTAFKILFAGIFLLDDYSHHSHHSGGQLLERMGFLRRQPWAVATLYDAYFGFITFWIWVAYKENTLWSRLLWLALILSLANIAMSLYVLIQLFRLKPEPSVEALFRR